jgi:hypothetical protein
VIHADASADSYCDRSGLDELRAVKEVAVVGTDEAIQWPMAISAHMSLEGGPLLQLALTEMLLQCYSGTLRVFPAVTPDWEGPFPPPCRGRLRRQQRSHAGQHDLCRHREPGRGPLPPGESLAELARGGVS